MPLSCSQDQTAVLIHENVRGFDFTVLVENLEGWIFVHFEHFHPSYWGDNTVSRRRRVDVAICPEKAALIPTLEMKGMYAALCKKINSFDHVSMLDVWVEDATDVASRDTLIEEITRFGNQASQAGHADLASQAGQARRPASSDKQ